ncbi:serine hydrolase [Ahrensia sp. R2A130]|uniref:serine hydrolase n=1 Tax=Ahrensia sp. R2A130 TaxID=744979 RepID=UPI0001E0A472|nr:serine hydrolase [Ahrensia sp. R2A130]EFL89660.1 beta-lactamase related protein [Ahrensia sp. R2A130]
MFARTLLILFLFVAPISAAFADSAKDTDFLRTLYEKTLFDEGDFAPSFLRVIDARAVRLAVKSMRGKYGPLIEVSGSGTRFTIATESHTIPIIMRRDPEGQIVQLSMRTPSLRVVDIQALLERFDAMPGTTSAIITRNGKMEHELRPDQKLGVGSAFKIAVLSELKNDIASGKRTWADTVALKETDRSLPTGTLQTWPVGAPLTLYSLAALMISTSDNTATDMLIDVVGRGRVATALDLEVMLKTRDFFQLKANPLEANAWRNNDTARRRQQLEVLATLPLPPVEAVQTPRNPDVEWAVSTRHLCALMEELGEDPIAAIEPGFADPKFWDSVTYKGGSTTGVLNLTHRVTKGDEAWCVSLTWNGDGGQSPTTINEIAASLLAALHDKIRTEARDQK